MASARRRQPPQLAYFPDATLIRGDLARARYEWVRAFYLRHGECELNAMLAAILRQGPSNPFYGIMRVGRAGDVQLAGWARLVKLRQALRGIHGPYYGDPTPGQFYTTFVMVKTTNGSRLEPRQWAACDPPTFDQITGRYARMIAGFTSSRDLFERMRTFCGHYDMWRAAVPRPRRRP